MIHEAEQVLSILAAQPVQLADGYRGALDYAVRQVGRQHAVRCIVERGGGHLSSQPDGVAQTDALSIR